MLPIGSLLQRWIVPEVITKLNQDKKGDAHGKASAAKGQAHRRGLASTVIGGALPLRPIERIVSTFGNAKNK
jgi:hypothetical protein